ncbi:MAG: transaldolase [Bacteriovoracaceae bacterium]|jgi:transaldolase|nr:transaldolase [Bacteriovoracaceae bacterium]
MNQLKVKLYSDGAKMEDIKLLADDPNIAGFTTNPSLMKQAGASDYKSYSKEILSIVPNKPLSFEVFADEFDEMYRQALDIKTWGENVYVKIPVMNTKRQYAYELIEKLTKEGVKLNVTALFTEDQVRRTVTALEGTSGSLVSIFAGRIADTGVDPKPLMTKSCEICSVDPKMELLWASTREVYNIFEADQTGCDIITVPPSILKKMGGIGKDLEEYSLDTVKGFYKDATEAGFSL